MEPNRIFRPNDQSPLSGGSEWNPTSRVRDYRQEVQHSQNELRRQLAHVTSIYRSLDFSNGGAQ
ncbi:MAG: hypothetical protein FJ276_19955 [Planctomycetes bacterium]|nr:hypothetical protein [Planctomycetota bacterium]